MRGVQYLDKLVFVNMQGNRKVSGYLRGYDIFLNVVVDDAREETIADKVNCGTVVRPPPPPLSLPSSAVAWGAGPCMGADFPVNGW